MHIGQVACKLMAAIEGYPSRRAYFIGGHVRDRVMRMNNMDPPDQGDVDVEVFGISYQDLKVKLMDAFYKNCHYLNIRRVDFVGKDFGIIKVVCKAGDIDFSIPRRENRIGIEHTAFKCEFDPSITIKEAAGRRDFTMNAMMETTTGEFIDPYNGMEDIRNRLLVATSDAFTEDPLRVLRGMQFASRFNMKMDARTLNMSRNMLPEFNTIAVERVWMEWKKWAKGSYPSAGLELLRQTHWLADFHEICSLVFCNQEPEWHPEGNAWDHTLHVCDAAAKIADEEQYNEEDRLVFMFAALLHDVGKPSTTVTVDGRIKSPAHAHAGAPLAEDFLSSIGAPKWLIKRVIPLVKEHMVHIGVDTVTKRVIMRLSRRLEPSTIPMLRQLVVADNAGRPPLPGKDPMKEWEDRANELEVASGKPDRILMGRHLIARGLEPGPWIGTVLAKVYEAQLDGEFEDLDGAFRWMHKDHEIIALVPDLI